MTGSATAAGDVKHSGTAGIAIAAGGLVNAEQELNSAGVSATNASPSSLDLLLIGLDPFLIGRVFGVCRLECPLIGYGERRRRSPIALRRLERRLQLRLVTFVAAGCSAAVPYQPADD